MKNVPTTNRPLITMLVIALGMAGFTGYCYVLLDWIQDLSTGVYTTKVWEGTYETGALLLYSAGALRFINRKFDK